MQAPCRAPRQPTAAACCSAGRRLNNNCASSCHAPVQQLRCGAIMPLQEAPAPPPRTQQQHLRCAASRQSSADRSLWCSSQWTFPVYLHTAVAGEDAAGQRGRRLPVGDSAPDHACSDTHPVWAAVRREAMQQAAFEPVLSSFLHASVLAHSSFELSLAFVLANRLADSILLPAQLFDIFCEVLLNNPSVAQAALDDIKAFHARDPACTSYAMALLFYKGFHSLQTHRIASVLWQRDRRLLATTLQSRHSQVLGVDIHPAAVIGSGVFMDHACGVVIGETCVIGNNVTIMQDVTLGGTGKEAGDRHPKIGDNVLIGASAKVLGNIQVGKGALIAPGALVLRPVEPYTMVAGAPAQPVGVRPAAIRMPDNGSQRARLQLQ